MSILPKQNELDLEKVKDILSPAASPPPEIVNEVFKRAALKGKFDIVKEIIETHRDVLEPFDIPTKRLIAFRGHVKLLKYIDLKI